MSFRILAVGDMHLGRRPRQLPEGLIDHGIETRSLAPTAAWHRTVEAALEEKVDAVLLAGDVVESLEDRFEAYGHLETGVKTLVEAGIRVLGVTGNHDVKALPRLARQIPDFRLLGAGGQWECCELERNGERLRIAGWSFPKKHHSENPLIGFPALPDDGVCTVGLLHCDLDAPRSDYAPVRLAELEQSPCDAWLLGHIHVPSELSSPRPIGYLGSIAGLDPGEAGARGPWLLEAHGKGRVDVTRQLLLSPLRWEREVIDCSTWDEATGVALDSQLEAAVHSALERVHSRLRRDLELVRAVGVRMVLRGKTHQHAPLKRLIQNSSFRELVRSFEDVRFFPEKLLDELSPAIDLEELAKLADPPGLLARKLLLLESRSPEADKLLVDLEREVEAGEQKRTFWNGPGVTRSSLRERALRCGMTALEDLLQQRTRELLVRFERIRVERAPGVEQPFELTGFSPGFNVVLGPNGSGKSLVCRVVQELLWSAGRPSGTTASAEVATELGRIAVRCDEDVNEWDPLDRAARRPALPARHLAGCFLLHAGDLLSTGAGTDLEIAREVKNQMAGGYDLDAVRAERFTIAPKHGKSARRALDAAERELARVGEEFRGLSQEEEGLAELDRQIDSAERAAERVRILEALRQLAQERDHLALLTAKVSALPSGMEQLSGAEQENLDERDETLAARLAELEAADAELARKRAQLADLVPEGPQATTEEIAAWRERAAKLARLEERCEELAERAAALDAAWMEAQAHLAGDLVEEDSVRLSSAVLDQVDEHLRLTLNNREALATNAARLRALLPERESSNSRDLERAVASLREWCAEPYQAADLARRPWLWVFGVLLTAAGVALAQRGEPAWYAATGAGLTLVVWALSIGSTCGAAQTRRDEAAAGFPERDVAPPEAWTLDEVHERLAELELEYSDALAEDDRAREREYLLQGLAELEVAQDRLDETRAELAAETGLGSGISELSLVEVAHRLDGVREASVRSSEADAQVDEAQSERAAQTAALTEWLAARGIACCDAADGVEALRVLDERVREAARLAQEIAALEERRPQLTKAIETCRQRVTRTYLDSGLEDGDRVGLERRLAVLGEYRTLEREREVSKAQIARLLESVPDGEGNQGEAELGEALRVVEEEAGGLNDLVAQRGASRERLRAARSGTRMEDALDEVAKAKDALTEKHAESLDAGVGSFLLGSVSEEYRQSSSPEVLRRAVRLFAQFTQNKYELMLDDSGDQTRFYARDVVRNRRVELSELSDGTRMQLLLAARFAYALDIEDDGVPFFLDEALSFSDPERFAEIASVLFTLVKEGRQIIYLTSRQVEVDAFVRAASLAECETPRVLDLAEARGLDSVAREPGELSYELIPALPPIGKDTPEEYAVRIGVPLPAPESAADGLHLFFLLREDLGLLRELAVAGCTTVGQWRASVSSGAALSLCADERRTELLTAQAEIVEAVFEAWNIGRGKRVGRSQFLASGAVSEKYQTNFTELAEDCGGDAERFLAAFGERKDERTSRFSRKKLEQLTQWLEEHEYLDSRPRLDQDAARIRVLAAAGLAIRENRLTTEQVVALTASIWFALEQGEAKRRATQIALEESLTPDGA